MRRRGGSRGQAELLAELALLARRQGHQHRVGVGRQRPGDPAERVIAGAGDQPPRAVALAWIGGDEVGIAATQALPEGELALLIEKDFQCLAPRAQLECQRLLNEQREALIAARTAIGEAILERLSSQCA